MNDSLFNTKQAQQFQSIDFDEKLRQQEIASAELKRKEERSHNLQDAVIVICLITFVILFLLLRILFDDFFVLIKTIQNNYSRKINFNI